MYIYTTYIYIHTYKERERTSAPYAWHTVAKMNRMLCCRSLSAKQPLITGLFCGKRPIKIRHPMGLGHPVAGWLLRNHEKSAGHQIYYVR